LGFKSGFDPPAAVQLAGLDPHHFIRIIETETGHVTLAIEVLNSPYIFHFHFRFLVYIVSRRMSTFGGLMKEYRLISLDRFDGINLESTVYMLSHNHSGKNTPFCRLCCVAAVSATVFGFKHISV